jgi:uncharacterized BrkB/YihY/UPF0761 family membrane protein
MVYALIVPAWLWAVMLFMAWTALGYQAVSRLKLRHPIMIGLLVVLAFQAIAAVVAAAATSLNRISSLACFTGYYGIVALPVVALVVVVALIVLYRVTPQFRGDGWRGLLIWLLIWLGFNLLIFSAHFRSVAFCTV